MPEYRLKHTLQLFAVYVFYDQSVASAFSGITAVNFVSGTP